jgi:glycosyltransferase involved in cell wall biosynthesis
MLSQQLLISIGIPTYNRVDFLKKAIDSALNQDYPNIEVIVSDNASNDGTRNLCLNYCNDTRFKYIRSDFNRGPTENFYEVLSNAKGHFFMWLGDDDWIDSAYVSSCATFLFSDKSVSLVSGAPKYYRSGSKLFNGKVFSLESDFWWMRVILYYWKVTDNGMFYGLMRTNQIKELRMTNTIGGDWLLISSIAYFGKIKVISNVSVHRELGGATVSYKKIAASLGLPKIQGLFPNISIATSALVDIVKKNAIYSSEPISTKFFVGIIIFLVIMVKAIFDYVLILLSKIKIFALTLKKFLYENCI